MKRCEMAWACQFKDHLPNTPNPSSVCSWDHFHMDSLSLCFMWKMLMGNGDEVWKEGTSNLAKHRKYHQQVHLFSTTWEDAVPEGGQGLSWWKVRLNKTSDHALLKRTVNGTFEIETGLKCTSSHCWPWMKGRELIKCQVGAGSFKFLLILILWMTLWDNSYYFHFSDYQ